MTPLQQAYLNKLQATAAANLEFFKLNMPKLYDRVIRANPATTVDISDQGDLVLRHPDGTSRPLTALMRTYADRFAEFDDPVKRHQFLAFHNLRVVRGESETEHGGPSQYFYSRLDTEFANRLRQHFTKHYPDEEGLSRYPSFGDRKIIPLLIVIGSDVGFSLSRLVADYQVRHLVLMDTDIDAFRLTTFFQDYIELSRIAMEKGTDLTFIIEPDIEQLARAFMHALAQDLPPFFIHGAALFRAMPQTETLEKITTMITDTLWELFYGLGFFDDEIISIRHTLLNLPRSLPIYGRPNVVADERAYAFVVGAGPSLDELMPILKRHADQVVIISCGTALAALHQAGIEPDFHIEMERTALTYEVLVNALPPDYLRRIRLVTTQVMEPRVLELFESAWLVIKEADTMGNLLVQMGLVARPPLETQPTVTNMGLSLALGLGFRKICLFGVDVGYKSAAKHHAQDTVYHGRMPRPDHLRRLLGSVARNNLTVPGNFGGTVLTNFVFDVARKHLSNWIRAHPEAQVFNPNDGAMIEGAITIRPDSLARRLEEDLPASPDKGGLIARIEEAFTPLEFTTAPIASALLDEFDRFAAKVRGRLGRKFASRSEVIDGMVEVYQTLREEVAQGTPASYLFRGVLLHLMSLAFNAASIILDEDEAVAKALYDFALIDELFEAARLEVIKAIDATVH